MNPESINALEVQHNEAESRFEIEIDGQAAILEYQRPSNFIIFTHTEVPKAFEGMGIANKLAFAALEYAKEQGLRVMALCPFIKSYIHKHKEYHAITIGFSEAPQQEKQG